MKPISEDLCGTVGTDFTIAQVTLRLPAQMNLQSINSHGAKPRLAGAATASISKPANLPKLTKTHSRVRTCSQAPKTRGFLFSSQRISKSPNLCCDNYPCCSPTEHLHNHHQPFTEDTQRIIMRQQRNKRHFGKPLKTRAAAVASYCARNTSKQEERCSDRLFRKGKNHKSTPAKMSPRCLCCVTPYSLHRLLRWFIRGSLVKR